MDQYDMEIEHRPRTRHTNADGLSKRTNLYVMREQSLKNGPVVKEGFNFLDQEVYDALPMLETVGKQGRTVEPKVTPKVEIVQRKKMDCPMRGSEPRDRDHRSPGRRLKKEVKGTLNEWLG